MRNRTPAWSLMMFEFAVGIGLILTAGFLVWFGTQPCFSCSSEGRWLPVRPGLLIALIALLLALIGRVWMIRIFHGPRDEPPPWRYRDR
ncbi:MAG: hypothetical protein MUP92_04040 [Actinobacteria bacterium]|nr:hypothetical protein [Actinomycetota bacterium]